MDGSDDCYQQASDESESSHQAHDSDTGYQTYNHIGYQSNDDAPKLYLYEPARVLICLLCRAGIRPGPAVQSHFRKSHEFRGPKLGEIRDAAAAAVAATGGAGGLVDVHKATRPPDGSEAIPQLRVQAGFNCNACRFLTTNYSVIRQHWTGRGPRAAGNYHCQRPGPESWSRVALQSFSSARQLRRY